MRASGDVGAVLVHIDLDGDHVEPSSLAALAAGRAVASSWGATLYAALIAHDPNARRDPGGDDPTAPIRLHSTTDLSDVQNELGLAGADKIVVYGAPLMAVHGAGLPPIWVFALAIPLSMVGTAAGGVVLNRLSDLNFKRYLRLILSVIGLVYLAQAVRLFWLG